MKLVFVASQLSIHHKGERAKTVISEYKKPSIINIRISGYCKYNIMSE
jgi:hypothetical protein